MSKLSQGACADSWWQFLLVESHWLRSMASPSHPLRASSDPHTCRFLVRSKPPVVRETVSICTQCWSRFLHTLLLVELQHILPFLIWFDRITESHCKAHLDVLICVGSRHQNVWFIRVTCALHEICTFCCSYYYVKSYAEGSGVIHLAAGIV